MAGQIVEFSTNGSNSRGYLAVPASGAGPGVVVLQEWWGLVKHIETVCDRFAKEGFVAFAPDLYDGESTANPDDAGRLMMALEIERAERDLRSAVGFLLVQPATTGGKVGVVGFCMGGQLALYAASKSSDIGACADFYGIHPNVQPELDDVQCPVLGIFAENDAFVTPQAARELESALERSGVETEFHFFPGVDHAFFNDSRPEVYDARAAKEAWQKTLAFFRRHIG